MAEGWVKAHRQLAEHPMWLAEKFTRGQAWMDLIMLANHKPGHIRIQGVKIDVQRGDVGWSEVALSARWKWSRGKVRRFMAQLADEQMLTPKRYTGQDKRNCLSTIVNYEKFQGENLADDTGGDTRDGHATDMRRYTNKNEKNEKKKDKDFKDEEVAVAPALLKKHRFTPPSFDEVRGYCAERRNGLDPQGFIDFYAAKGWLVGKTPMKDWKAAIRTWEARRREEQGIGAPQETRRSMNLDDMLAEARSKQ